MTRRPILRSLLAVSLLAGAIASMGLAGPNDTEPGSDRWWESVTARFGGTPTDTKPARDVTMSFTFPVQIASTGVEGGQRVSEGDVLVRARDDEVVAALELQRLRAESNLGVQDAENTRELAQFHFDQMQEAKRRGSISPLEEQEVRITLAQSNTRVEQAKEDKRLEELRYQQQRGQFDRYRLEAPFDAQVEEVYVDAGQTMNETEPVVRIVDTSRLVMDPNPPLALVTSRGIRGGSPAWVLLRIGAEPVVVRGVVRYVSPVADAVTQTVRVRVELDNPSNWPAGAPASVRFDDPGQGWADGAVGVR